MKLDHNHPNKVLPADQRTFQILTDIANSIDPNIQFTFDCPSLNDNNRVPVLDLEFWIENNDIMHAFYKKPISNECIILQRSAMSARIKRETAFNEGLKRVTYSCFPIDNPETIGKFCLNILTV